ncbi:MULTISPECIES: helix-turn-helix domain-containing protein [unclassified Nocardia]|uniref:GbsR/MarR family transcriptional regulator n=1 Tax=unclassified Nocardia TaxID=2637762 RepID=UPI0035DE3A4E
MPGGRLTDEDRQRIAAGLAAGLAYAEIGRRLDRPASTIMREVTRNGGPDGYRAAQAHRDTRQRARRRKEPRPATPPPLDTAHGRDPGAVRDISETFTDQLMAQGLPRMEARVLSCLQFSDSGALTAADLVRRLSVSAASVSHAVGFLESQSMLRRERVPGLRRERYVIDDKVWLCSLLTSMQTNHALAVTSKRAAEILGPGTPAGTRFEYAAEILDLVNHALNGAMDEWRRILAERDGGRR